MVLRAGSLFLAFLTLCSGQDLTALRSGYESALNRWESTDPNLESELFRNSEAEMLARIDAAATLRVAVGQAKAAYFAGLGRAYRGAANQLLAPAPPALAKPRFNSDMLAEAGRLVEALNGQIRRSAGADGARLAALQQQKSGLIELQFLLSDWQRKLDAVPSKPASVAGAAPAAATLNSLAAEFEIQAQQVAVENKVWAGLYETMRDEVRRRSGEPAAATAASSASSAPPTIQTVPGTGLVVPNLAGEWVARNAAVAQASSITLRMSQSADQVDGVCEITYPGDGRAPVTLPFEGRIQSDFMRFALKTPLRGSVVLQRSGATKLQFSYAVDKPVPRGLSVRSLSGDTVIEFVRP